jgi:polyphosphate:AMP phosphotransferase
MFETAELGRTIDKEEYRKRVPTLRTALLEAQARLQKAKFPVLLLISGVDGAGKGETVNLLLEWLDPRYLSTHAFGPPTDEERERPPFWRYWRTLPPKGRIGIFFGSWYTEPIVDLALGRTKLREFAGRLAHIRNFEKALVDDGALLIKLWFHLSKKAQAKRLHDLQKDPRTRWRVTAADREHHESYERFLEVSEQALRETSTGEAPWVLVEGEHDRYRSLTVGEHVLASITRRLDEADVGRKSCAAALPSAPPLKRDEPTILDTIDLSQAVPPEEYEDRLARAQGRLHRLWRDYSAKKRSAILVFEGWDAAGKGGAIRRITPAIDARSFQIIAFAAPTDEEKAQHYLWRFWRHLPRNGTLTLFDRSWYGRVLVERIEGFCRPDEWTRAYAEINDFEAQLREHGILLVKYWLHIDKKEQLRRFKERERIPFKRYKITAEDYRNRKKWDEYERAAHDMVAMTSTSAAPWHLIPANDKKSGRLRVLEILCDALKNAGARS